MTVFKLFGREMNRKAAGQQTDGEEDRCLQHFAGSRSAESLSQLKEIRDDENSEDRRLGDNEAGHPDLAPVWKLPFERDLSDWTRGSTHFSILLVIALLIATVRIFWVLQVPQGTAARNHRNGSKVVRGRRRTYRPFQSPGVPWIVAGFWSFEVGINKVRDEHECGYALDECADRNDQVEGFPTRTGL